MLATPMAETSPPPAPNTDKDLAEVDGDPTVATAKTRASATPSSTAGSTLSAPPGATSATLSPTALPPEPITFPDGALHVAGDRHADGDLHWVSDPWTGARLAPVVLASAAHADRAARASADAMQPCRRHGDRGNTTRAIPMAHSAGCTAGGLAAAAPSRSFSMRTRSQKVVASSPWQTWP